MVVVISDSEREKKKERKNEVRWRIETMDGDHSKVKNRGCARLWLELQLGMNMGLCPLSTHILEIIGWADPHVYMKRAMA